MSVARNRLHYVFVAIAVIILSLLSRRFQMFPAALGKYPGDVFWAILVFLLWAILVPRASILTLSLCTLATSFIVEFSKLLPVPWLHDLRDTVLGRLILGTVFSWQNLFAYALGIVLAALVEFMAVPRRPARR